MATPGIPWVLVEGDPGLAVFLLRRKGGVLERLHEEAFAADPDWPLDALATLPCWHDAAQDSPPGARCGPAWPSLLGRHARATADAARWLAEQTAGIAPHAAYWAGLLYPLGLWALAAANPERFDDQLAQFRGGGPWRSGGRRIWGVDPFGLGRRLAQAWGLGDELVDCIWAHDAPPRLTSDRPLTHLVQWAAWLSQRAGFGLGPAEPPHLRALDPTDPEAGSAAVHASDPAAAVLLRKRLDSLPPDKPPADLGLFEFTTIRRAAELARENRALRRENAARRASATAIASLPELGTPAELAEVLTRVWRQVSGAAAVLCFWTGPPAGRLGRGVSGAVFRDSDRSSRLLTQEAAEPPFLELDSIPDFSSMKREAAGLIGRLGSPWTDWPLDWLPLTFAGRPLGGLVFWLNAADPRPPETWPDLAAVSERGLAAALGRAADEAELERLAEALQRTTSTESERFERRQLDALAEFAAGAGHEINNPLAVISGRAQLLLAQEADPNRRRSLEAILRQTERVHRMIVELMFFARPPAPQLDRADPARIVVQAIDALQAEAASRQIEIRLSNQLPQQAAVLVDPAQMAAAIESLIRNAVQASPDGELVEVQLRASHGEASQEKANEEVESDAMAHSPPPAGVEIEVRDNGRGIPEAVRSKIFDPFFSGREAGRGLGMGLPKAWRIVRNHGGGLSIRNRPGRGVSATVRLAIDTEP